MDYFEERRLTSLDMLRASQNTCLSDGRSRAAYTTTTRTHTTHTTHRTCRRHLPFSPHWSRARSGKALVLVGRNLHHHQGAASSIPFPSTAHQSRHKPPSPSTGASTRRTAVFMPSSLTILAGFLALRRCGSWRKTQRLDVPLPHSPISLQQKHLIYSHAVPALSKACWRKGGACCECFASCCCS